MQGAKELPVLEGPGSKLRISPRCLVSGLPFQSLKGSNSTESFRGKLLGNRTQNGSGFRPTCRCQIIFFLFLRTPYADSVGFWVGSCCLPLAPGRPLVVSGLFPGAPTPIQTIRGKLIVELGFQYGQIEATQPSSGYVCHQLSGAVSWCCFSLEPNQDSKRGNHREKSPWFPSLVGLSFLRFTGRRCIWASSSTTCPCGRTSRRRHRRWPASGRRHTDLLRIVDGQNPAPPKKPWQTIVCWLLQGNQVIPGFLGWCRISSIHSMKPCLVFPRPPP